MYLMLPHNLICGERVPAEPSNLSNEDNSTVLVSASISGQDFVNYATAIFAVFPLMLTQGAKKLTSEAQEARIADNRNVAVRPSM